MKKTFTLFYCLITVMTALADDVKDGSVWLSRPWRPYVKCIFIRCELGRHIRPEGWHNWGNPANEQTAYYAEYLSRGEGAHPDQRVSWSHQLTDISQCDMKTILADNDEWVVP